MRKRLFDIFCALFGLVFLAPLLIIIGCIIALDSEGRVVYKQVRVGKNNVDFNLFKFRTMIVGADKSGELTTSDRDARITSIGYRLRKFKLDELPQLINVLLGDMSLVGPRPEVRKYVSLYTPDQLEVLKVQPGITDYASLEYSNENELLAKQTDPEKYYVDVLMPAKIELNKKYIQEIGMGTDLKLIYLTLRKLIGI